MTATIREPDRGASRRRLRLASMEVLGFIDHPGAATTASAVAPPLTDTLMRPRGRHERIDSSEAVPAHDPFAEWRPAEMGSRLLGGNVRWGRLAGILLLIAGLGVLGYWLYQRPIVAAEEARQAMITSAGDLQPHLITLAEMNATLVAAEETPTPTEGLLAAESAARRLFASSADLPVADAGLRAKASDAAGDTLDAVRMLGDAYAYRSALIPMLASPALVTDPDLIELDEAARAFGDWRARFDSVRSALPANTLSTLTTELAALSGSLDSLQTRYLSALRDDDGAAAALVVQELETALGSAQSSLYDALTTIQNRVRHRLDEAAADLYSLLG